MNSRWLDRMALVAVFGALALSGATAWRVYARPSSSTTPRSAPPSPLPVSELGRGLLLGGVESRPAGQQVLLITVFSDYQCPACRVLASSIDSLLILRGDKVQVWLRQYPLTSIHPTAFRASQLAVCAAAHGKLREVHHALFQQIYDVADGRADRVVGTAVGSDSAAIGACAARGAADSAVQRDLELGRSLSISMTPTSYFGTTPVVGVQYTSQLVRSVDSAFAALRRRQE